MNTKAITAVTACALALVGVAETAITRQQADRMFNDAEALFKSAESKYHEAKAGYDNVTVLKDKATAIYNSATADYNNAVDKYNAALDAYKTFTPTNEADRARIERMINKAKKAKRSARCAGRAEQTNAVADRIRTKNAAELAAYTVTCTNVTGAARFDFKGNGGKFTILANGAKFETQWSACSANSVTAYRDGVELLGWNQGQADFPASASAFEAWDWKRRATEVGPGRVVAFMEKGGKILAVRVVKVSDRSHGASADELQVEYRVY